MIWVEGGNERVLFLGPLYVTLLSGINKFQRPIKPIRFNRHYTTRTHASHPLYVLPFPGDIIPGIKNKG